MNYFILKEVLKMIETVKLHDPMQWNHLAQKAGMKVTTELSPLDAVIIKIYDMSGKLRFKSTEDSDIIAYLTGFIFAKRYSELYQISIRTTGQVFERSVLEMYIKKYKNFYEGFKVYIEEITKLQVCFKHKSEDCKNFQVILKIDDHIIYMTNNIHSATSYVRGIIAHGIIFARLIHKNTPEYIVKGTFTND
jgi:hypothetical protein